MWGEKSLREVCIKILSGGTPNTKVEYYYKDGDIFWLKTKEVLNNYIYKTESKITKEGLCNSSAKLLPVNSVIIAMYGDGKTAGRVAINKVPLATNQACCNLVINNEIADYKYVFYNLLSRYDEFVQLKSGGSQQNLNTKTIGNLKLKIPSLSIQQKIADILSSYDNLIENNNRRIQLLEQSAQQVYKEWFERFRFPGYESTHFTKGIPDGWKVVRFSEIVKIIDGDRGTNYPNQNEMFDEGFCLFLNAGNVTTNGFDYSKNTFISKDKDSKLRKGKLNKDDIVLTTRGTVGNVALYNRFVPFENVRINSGMVIIRPICSVTNTSFLYLQLRSSTVQQLITLFASGSAQPQLPIKDMKGMKVLIPSIESLTKFEVTIKPILDSIGSNMAKNQNLIKQRDLLLPRLISGKLEG